MKIGIFDSGLGGLSVAKALFKELPQYDYVYLGDTARVPYGNRSPEKVLEFTIEGIEFLFSKECVLIILACNTASAEALRRIQQVYIPQKHPEKKVLGVLIPSAEEAVKCSLNGIIGVIATQGTVNSGAFKREIEKRNTNASVYQNAAPLLVPLVENNGFQWASEIVQFYLKPLLEKGIDTLVLGCTHYPFLRTSIEESAKGIKIISQDTIISRKLEEYLEKHTELCKKLSTTGVQEFYLTDITTEGEKLANTLLEQKVLFQKAHIEIR